MIRSHLIFFFSSRRRHTRLVSDWSSDVCSSDLSGRLTAGYFLGSSGRWLCLRRRSEEHTSELQSLTNLVCRLLLEKKKKKIKLGNPVCNQSCVEGDCARGTNRRCDADSRARIDT